VFDFNQGIIIQQAQLEKGLTLEELPEKCGTNKKRYVSRKLMPGKRCMRYWLN
jgi:hypothetical protein